MTDLMWKPLSPLQAIVDKGASSNANAGIHLNEIRNFAAVQIMAKRGQWAALSKAAKAAFGVMPPASPSCIAAKTNTLLWSGPDQFIALSPMQNGGHVIALQNQLSAFASLSDQTDGRVWVSVSGPRARAMLAKICSLDLHPDVFPVGTAAVTAIDHLSTNIWRSADDGEGHPVFNMLLLSTFAISLWGLIVDSSHEYGVQIGSNAL